MAEGNPHQTNDANVNSELKIIISSESAKRYGVQPSQDTRAGSP